MPVGPETAAGIAQAMVAAHERAELLLLARLARAVARGVDTSSLDERLAAGRALAASARAIVAGLATQTATEASAAVLAGAAAGAAAGRDDLPAGLLARLDALPDLVPGARAAALVAADLTARLTSTHAPLLRCVDDAYRRATAEAVTSTLLGAGTRRQAAQQVLNTLAGQGLSGFTDRRGRRWEAATYAETATRAATTRAVLAAHDDQMGALGINLVVVSDAPQECRLCRPFEGKVLHRSTGSPGRISLPSITGPGVVEVDVHGTLADARSQGLFHPGCRHSVKAYLPGATRLREPDSDPQGEKDRQRLRALERQVRAAKRQEAAALDPAAATVARTRVRQAQGSIREHVATSSARRQPARERVGVAR